MQNNFRPSSSGKSSFPPRSSVPVQAMVTTGDVSPLQDDWFFNTGATHHLTNNSQYLEDVKPYIGSSQVTIGNDQSLPISHFSNKLLSTSSKQ